LQATGRDARGRKQYRYHSDWVVERDAAKYDRLLAFGRLLPAIRKRVRADLAQPGLAREKVLAAVVSLLQATFIRVGNPEYAKQNRSFGLTTLRDRHVDITGSRLRFRFRGKSGIDHDVDINDARLARIVKRCQDIPGQHLFQYLDDDGGSHGIDSGDVNEYLRQITGGDFSAKDLRTWAGTVLFAQAVRRWGNLLPAKRWVESHVRQAIKHTAQQLGNTAAICRRCYVHPAVIKSFSDGSLIEIFDSIGSRNGRTPVFGLRAEEKVVLEVLKRA
jgi:DNA topoisomerase-1